MCVGGDNGDLQWNVWELKRKGRKKHRLLKKIWKNLVEKKSKGVSVEKEDAIDQAR